MRDHMGLSGDLDSFNRLEGNGLNGDGDWRYLARAKGLVTCWSKENVLC